MPGVPSESDPPGTRGSPPVEMAASVHNTVSKFKHSGTCFHADIHTFERRLHNLMWMNEDPSASQHQSRRIGSHLFARKLKDGLKEYYCKATSVPRNSFTHPKKHKDMCPAV